MASRALMDSAPSSASAADDMTALMSCAKLSTAPLSSGSATSDERKKCPPARLRALGFQTFEPWWDEGYGEDPPDHQLKEIVHLVEHLGNKSIDKLTSMYAEMQPVLEHNFQRLMKIQKQDLHA